MKKLVKIVQDNRGFTLVELIIATVILSVIMAPLMRSFIMASNMSQNAKSYGAATVSVENAIETVKNASASSFATDLEARYGADSVTFTPDPAAQTVTGTYEFEDGTDEIEVVIREPDSSDDLALLNSQNLAAYTNMDLTLIQTSGSYELNSGDLGYDDAAGGSQYVLNDIDVLGISNVIDSATSRDNTLTGKIIAKEIKRDIEITLAASSHTTSVEVVAEDGTTSIETQTIPVLKYEIYYKYSYGTHTNSQRAFSGIVSAGSDDVISLQFVYVPLNQEASTCNETINIEYSSLLTDIPVRLFLIKQVRTTHALSCSTAGLGTTSYNEDQTPRENLNCGTCASAEYDDRSYFCDVTLSVPNSSADIDLYSNIHYNIYSDTYLPESRFNYKEYVEGNVSSSSSLADKLVVSVSGGRVYIVEITSTNTVTKEVSYMQTLKLT